MPCNARFTIILAIKASSNSMSSKTACVLLRLWLVPETPYSTQKFFLGSRFLGCEEPGEALFPRCQQGLLSQRKSGMPLVAAAFSFVFANHAE